MRDPVDVVTDFFERLWNGRELHLAEALIASDCVTHQQQSGSPDRPVPRGPDAIRHHVGEWLQAFPDLRIEVRQILGSGDRVAVQCSMEGTHEGPWMGVPPTGRRTSIEMMVLYRVENGKIVEDWVVIESYGFFEQLGLVPSKPDLLASAGAGKG